GLGGLVKLRRIDAGADRPDPCEPSRRRRVPPEPRRLPERRVTSEDLVTTEARQRDTDAQIGGGPRDHEDVHAVDRGLVHGRQRSGKDAAELLAVQSHDLVRAGHTRRGAPMRPPASTVTTCPGGTATISIAIVDGSMTAPYASTESTAAGFNVAGTTPPSRTARISEPKTRSSPAFPRKSGLMPKG